MAWARRSDFSLASCDFFKFLTVNARGRMQRVQ
jgi:hypothetical protein